MKKIISKRFHRLGILLAVLVFIFDFLFLSSDDWRFSLLDTTAALICALLVYGTFRFIG
ncbi:hypothetical protein HEM54_001525 [Escherichia coli]|uniref:hypothetical protein n=1 Tax=Escherichia coli TaxID=562 RepID=UPI0012FFA13A|nr:hypothetical protein [Escherichia coli]MBB7458801.1 hypothetical protein [Escherichia coli]MBB8243600.1 hypothetical protein [Escherichia coli]HAZ3906018.1 hypothetical protein [Escherichia coli]HBA7188743.1 hypothetical protein [Escherichia coli]HBA9461191.1 hypothetical protein [Escherichia coli]